MEDINNEPIIKKSKKKINKKKLDDLLLIDDISIIDNDKNNNNELPVIENNYYYKNKLKVYVLSGQIKDLYGKIITEHELNKLSEQECENIYKICELKTAKKISDSVIDGIVSIIGNVCSRTLPIDNKDKYISDLKNDYIINSELKNVAGNVAMRTGKLMGVLSFIIITASNIDLYRKTIKEIDKQDEKESQEITHELVKELDQQLQK